MSRKNARGNRSHGKQKNNTTVIKDKRRQQQFSPNGPKSHPPSLNLNPRIDPSKIQTFWWFTILLGLYTSSGVSAQSSSPRNVNDSIVPYSPQTPIFGANTFFSKPTLQSATYCVASS